MKKRCILCGCSKNEKDLVPSHRYGGYVHESCRVSISQTYDEAEDYRSNAYDMVGALGKNPRVMDMILYDFDISDTELLQ